MENFSLLDQVIGALNSRKGQWQNIAREAEVPYHTLSKIARGANRDPGVRKVERLASVLLKAPA
jgi:predicted transcriptional regulator